jgi:hypothetical protein
MEGWRERHDNWVYCLWDDEALGDLEMSGGCRSLYERYVKEGCYNGAANVARVEILRTFGGVYVDADMKCLANMGRLLAKGPFWVCESPHEKGRPQNAVIGACAGVDVLELYAEALAGVDGNIKPSWRRSGSGLLQPIMENLGWMSVEGTMLNSCSFHPFLKNGVRNPGLDAYLAEGGIVYADHLFYTTNKGRMRQGKELYESLGLAGTEDSESGGRARYRPM